MKHMLIMETTTHTRGTMLPWTPRHDHVYLMPRATCNGILYRRFGYGNACIFSFFPTLYELCVFVLLRAETRPQNFDAQERTKPRHTHDHGRQPLSSTCGPSNECAYHHGRDMTTSGITGNNLPSDHHHLQDTKLRATSVSQRRSTGCPSTRHHRRSGPSVTTSRRCWSAGGPRPSAPPSYCFVSSDV